MSAPLAHDPFFPWNHLGLRANPFQSLKAVDWVEVSILPSGLTAWLDQPTKVLQISGEKGVGKTSTLYALMRTYSQMGLEPMYIYIADGEQKDSPNFDHHGLLLIDEVQRLPAPMRNDLFERFQPSAKDRGINPGLIFTTHADFRNELEQHTLDYMTMELTIWSAKDLGRFLEKRLQFFSHGDHCEVQFQRQAVEFLRDKFGDDLRSMEAFLYEFFQAIPDEKLISASILESFHQN